MGRIVISFFWNAININSEPLNNSVHGRAQALSRKYGISRIEELQFEGEDSPFEIDLNTTDDIINWDGFSYPNDNIRGKVAELIFYRSKMLQLEDIENSIERCSFEERYRIERYGLNAIDLISNVPESRYFPSLRMMKEDSIGNIGYTLNKEVKILTDYVKNNASNNRKQEALREAKRLGRDVGRFKIMLEHFNVNE